MQEFLDACLLHLISDCWKKKNNQRNILMNNGKDLHSNKNSLHSVLIESLSLVSKQVKQNTVFCILSEFSFRFLFPTINLKKRIGVRVGGCCISGFFVVCFLLLQLCCIRFSAYLIFKQVCHILKKTSKQKSQQQQRIKMQHFWCKDFRYLAFMPCIVTE